MDFLTSKRFVTTALVLLAILNITLLAVLSWQNFFAKNFHSIEVREYYTRSGGPEPDMTFSPEQRNRFMRLRREHLRKSLPEIQKMVALKKELIDESVKPAPDTTKIARIADMIGKEQAILERSLSQHFHELAGYCTPAQRDTLKAFLAQVYTRKYERSSRWMREIRPADEPGRGRQPHLPPPPPEQRIP